MTDTSSDNAQGLDFRTVNLKNLIIPPPTSKKGNLSTNPVYDLKNGKKPEPLSFQTPDVRIPFGLSDGKYAKDGAAVDENAPPRYSIAGAFDKYQEDGIMKEFYEFALTIEDFLIHLAAANSKQWFGTKYDPAVCRALMNRWVHVNKDEEKAAKYAPTFKGTVRQKKDQPGVFWTTCRGIDGEVMRLDELPMACTASMKLELSSIYVINGKFGATFEVKWIRVTALSTAAVFDYRPNLYGTAPIPALPPSTLQDAMDANTTEKKKRERDEAGDDNLAASTTEAGEPAPTKKANTGASGQQKRAPKAAASGN